MKQPMAKPATFGPPIASHAALRLAMAAGIALILASGWGLPGSALGQIFKAKPSAAASWAETAIPARARVHDFGVVPRGGILSHAFLVANPFAEPIAIAEPKASCGCTSVRVSANIAPPGGSVTIESTMDTAKFAGRKEVTVTVKLARQGKGTGTEVRLTLSADIQDNLRLTPGLADLGAMTRDQPTRGVLLVERQGDSAWRIERMISANPHLDAELTELGKDGDWVRYRLTTWIKETMPSGPIRDEIRFITNDPKLPVFPVMVTGFVREPLRIAPELLNMGSVPSDRASRARFAIRADEPFQIMKVEGLGDGFVWEPGDSAPKTAHLIQIVFDPKRSRIDGEAKRTFRVHTNLRGPRSIVEMTVVLRSTRSRPAAEKR